MDIREIEQGLKKPGKSKKGLAEALGRSPSAVTDLLRKDGKPREIKAREIPIIRKYLELDPVVPIVGIVGATSDEVYYGEASDTPEEYVPAPAGASPDTVAVEIKGDSLGPAFNGWLAFYNDRRSPITSNLIGVLCVVGLTDGRVLIKTPKQASGKRFHLFPNTGTDVIPDVKIAWAARVIHMEPKGRSK